MRSFNVSDLSPYYGDVDGMDGDGGDVRERATQNKKILAHNQDHMQGERQRIIPFVELAEDCRWRGFGKSRVDPRN